MMLGDKVPRESSCITIRQWKDCKRFFFFFLLTIIRPAPHHRQNALVLKSRTLNPNRHPHSLLVTNKQLQWRM